MLLKRIHNIITIIYMFYDFNVYKYVLGKFAYACNLRGTRFWDFSPVFEVYTSKEGMLGSNIGIK